MNGSIVKMNYSERFRSSFSVNMTSSGNARKADMPEDDGKYEFIETYINENREKALADVSKISVLMVSRRLQRTVETLLYTPTQLISEIGGQFGVWIGVSFITLIEVVELVIELCNKCIIGRKGELDHGNASAASV